jgi:hypothetical protein
VTSLSQPDRSSAFVAVDFAPPRPAWRRRALIVTALGLVALVVGGLAVTQLLLR